MPVTTIALAAIEVAAGLAITESIERTDLLEAAADAVSIQESAITMTGGMIGTMMMIADAAEIAITMMMADADHVAIADAERSIRNIVIEAAVKAVVIIMTTIPTRTDAGPEAEMKGGIGSLLDTATTRAEDMPMSSRRKELYFDQRSLSCLLIPLVRPMATSTARCMCKMIV